jgi:ribosome-associated heat shock protein Hsp15
MQSQRLDKWLWCARLVKTRTGGARLVEAGKVRINGARALKSSRPVHTGDVVTAMLLGRLFVVRVLAAVARRGPAPLARLLYEDLTPQIPPVPVRGLEAGRAKGPRPTKRDRRRIDALRRGPER